MVSRSAGLPAEISRDEGPKGPSLRTNGTAPPIDSGPQRAALPYLFPVSCFPFPIRLAPSGRSLMASHARHEGNALSESKG
jgi:hypothetical protein